LIMAKKPKLNKVTLVKEMARERIGMPRPTRLVPNKRRKLLEKARQEEE
jgi:hypothetical protein